MIKNNNRRNGNRNTHTTDTTNNARCDFLSNCWNGATVLSAFQWISSEISRQTKPNETEPNKIKRSCTELNWAELSWNIPYRIVSYRSRKYWFSKASDNNVRLCEALRFNVQFIGIHAKLKADSQFSDWNQADGSFCVTVKYGFVCNMNVALNTHPQTCIVSIITVCFWAKRENSPETA